MQAVIMLTTTPASRSLTGGGGWEEGGGGGGGGGGGCHNVPQLEKQQACLVHFYMQSLLAAQHSAA